MPSRSRLSLQPTPWLTRREFLVGAAAATAAGIGLYSNEIARHELEITHRTFYLRRLHPAFDGFRIVQISDLHLEEYAEDFFLLRVIDQVNAIAPDLVLITGDFISRGPLSRDRALSAAPRCAAMLTRLSCPQRFGVLGNHDAAIGSHDIRAHLEANGTPILVNRHVPITRKGQHFWLAGIDDFSGGLPNLDLAVPAAPDAPVILMAHEPDFVQKVLTHPRGPLVDLVLSGHTHGGQIRLPGLRPFALPPLGKLYVEGHFLLGDLQLYVNRGIGTVGLPFRLNCPAEITIATLRTAR